MPNAHHCMADIETLSVRPDAAIISIGAVLFDPFAEDTEESIRNDPSRCFYQVVSFESNEAAGRHISGSTVKWWLNQDRDAQQALLNADATNLRQACVRFRLFCQDATPRPVRLWNKDPDFDSVIMKNAFDQLGEMWPFKFWETRSVRTITELAYPSGDEPQIGVGTAHNALDDSIRQALMVQHCHHVLTAHP